MSLVDYQVTRRIAEGRFGTVFAACHRPTGQEVAIKKIRARKNLPGLDFDPWFKSAERERDVLETVKHCNIIELLEHHVEPDATMAILIYPYLAWDLATVLERKKPLNEGSVKVLLRMLLEGVAFLHEHGVMHRDLKPPNLLIDGSSGELKVADFGSARFLQGTSSRSFGEQLMTRDVCTRWYKSPEMLFGSVTYSLGVDLWAVGCTFAELLSSVALFPGGSDLEQLCLIFQALGTPDEADWPEVRELPDYSKVQFQHRAPDIPDLGDRSDAAKELVWAFMRLNPVQRISAPQALFHRFFLEGCPASRAEEVLEGLSDFGHHQLEANVGSISPVGLSEFGSDCSLLSIPGDLQPVEVETTACGLWDNADALEEPPLRRGCQTPPPPADGIHKFKAKR
ncbi:unnamed protein product [Durusdinium trenchii]|uniref:Cyclin-dependent kinase 2 homolog n=1 Tax=Durusdinium trenchii TaxID=1381693 RepID=A0ABP0RHX1_9DINO